MRWPWQSRETREAVGGYTEIISRLVEAQAAGTTQLASATAATEATAGAVVAVARRCDGRGSGRRRRDRDAAMLGSSWPRPDPRGRVAACSPLHGRPSAADPGVDVVLGRRRGPGHMALHRDRVRAKRIEHVACAAIVGRVCYLGIADRPALLWTLTVKLGGRYRPAECEHRAQSGR